MTHTPGPWSHAPILSHGEYEICHDGCHAIAFVYAGDGLDEITTFPSESNARLMSAAPDLLDALEWMIEHDESGPGDDYHLAGLERAKAAVAKARGETD
jgi:hypothetical protein